ncbi:DUF1501 domain-containing protein [Acidicapsa acidisoli]|uniref:DUF1501 domain-containing protein n=1 Tax=Acidicapsa acidisoli TaxID=1615681 RepID=UPI0021E061B5|nr:DUF1501 domain-containing protein [Acidicapsa acidisoli]
MTSTRRIFLRNGALALAGTTALPAFLTRAVMAATTTATAQGKKLVVIFQRGAADGLNIVVPWREPNYYAMRPTIAIPQNQVLDLDGFFGLHPAMASLQPLYRQGHLAIIHATGSPDGTRSHFDAQDFMESGTPGTKSTRDGWLNRALQAEDLRRRQEHTAFRAVALGSDVPRTLEGKIPVLAISNVQDFAVGGRGPKPAPTATAFEAMYDQSSDSLLHNAGDNSFEAIKMLRATDPAHYTPSPDANYPDSPFAKNMKQIAQLLKANLGLEAAFTDIGGWDTHQNQGSTDGQLANRLRDFSDSIAAFWRDMGPDAESITLVTMSEFGRTAHQNGTGGTDHGHANAMFVLGGNVRGGKVYGKWPGLADHQLNEGRDLAITTDYRQVLGEVVSKTIGANNLEVTFPGAKLNPKQFLGLV